MSDNFQTTFYALRPGLVTASPRAHGVDLSKYDLKFTPETATGQLDFAIQRIGYGLVRDEAFEVLLPGTLQIPIRGGYHYLNSGIDWKAQADKFLGYVQGLPFHFFVTDFEGAFNTLSVEFAYRCWQWRAYVEQRTGKPVILYTGRYLYQDWLVPSQARYGINWDTVELWQAEYPFSPNLTTGGPTRPSGRTRPWKLWQYSSKADGTQYGLGRATACDVNVYNGTVQELRAWLGLGTPEPDPEPNPDPEVTMLEITKCLTDLNGRSAPDASVANVVMGLRNGDILVCDERVTGKGSGGAALEFTRVKLCLRAGVVVTLPATVYVAAATNYQQVLGKFETGGGVDLNTLEITGQFSINGVVYGGKLAKQ